MALVTLISKRLSILSLATQFNTRQISASRIGVLQCSAAHSQQLLSITLKSRSAHICGIIRSANLRYKTYGKRPSVDSEAEFTANRDILLFTHGSPKHFTAMLLFCVGSAVFFFTNAESFYTIGKSLRGKEQLSSETDGDASHTANRSFKIDMFQFKSGAFHNWFAALFGLLGTACLLCIVLLPGRMVKSAVLLSGGHQVCLTTFVPFGKTKYVVLPLTKLSTRQQWAPNRGVTIKCKGHRLPFILSGRGRVTNSTLFTDVFRATKTRS